MFSNGVSTKKIEDIPKAALKFLCKRSYKSHKDLLLKSGFSSKNVKSLETLCVEVFKTINSLNLRNF